MAGHTLRFNFDPAADAEAIEDDFGLALFAASCIYGRPGVRLDARYLVSSDGRRCVATVAGSAGEAALRVFTGLCTARLGDDGFRIEHVGGVTC
jgi:hypothetical protein